MSGFPQRLKSSKEKNVTLFIISPLTRVLSGFSEHLINFQRVHEHEIRNESAHEKLELKCVFTAVSTSGRDAWTPYSCIKVTLIPLNEGRINKGLLNLPGR